MFRRHFKQMAFRSSNWVRVKFIATGPLTHFHKIKQGLNERLPRFMRNSRQK